MRIAKIKTTATETMSASKPDLTKFADELRELGTRYGFTLISFGGMAPMAGSGKQTMFLAVWSSEQVARLS
jgi:hypothetical protein